MTIKNQRFFIAFADNFFYLCETTFYANNNNSTVMQ